MTNLSALRLLSVVFDFFFLKVCHKEYVPSIVRYVFYTNEIHIWRYCGEGRRNCRENSNPSLYDESNERRCIFLIYRYK